MALAMVGVRYKSDKRDQYLQHGGWFVKVALWLLFNVVAFFLPVGLVNAYGAGPWARLPPRSPFVPHLTLTGTGSGGATPDAPMLRLANKHSPRVFDIF